MPTLLVKMSGTLRQMTFTPGASLRDILSAADVPVRSGCSGNGSCGLCRVRIEAGGVPSPTPSELMILPRTELERRTRLACQIFPEEDLRVEVIDPGPRRIWRDLPPGDVPLSPPVRRSEESSRMERRSVGRATGAGRFDALGLAVDLGTSHLSFSLWDLRSGERLCGRLGPNPQSEFGADVVTRLVSAAESPEAARRLARLPLDAIGEVLRDLQSESDLAVEEVGRVTIVGNNPMLVLLSEAGPSALLRPPHAARPVELPLPELRRARVRALGIRPRAKVQVVSGLAGFVGSDLLAGALAARILDQPGTLLLDVGTNSEVALWDGGRLWVTSAAGGPAFEGSGSRCGMPAGPGAICRVARAGDQTALRGEVIGGGEPRGLCGSGLVDLVACLRGAGSLTPVGRFASTGERGLRIPMAGTTLELTARDVDGFQRAKAGISLAIRALLESARMGTASLRRICVGGVFGRQLDIGNAQLLGLLPDVPRERVELCGNTSLAGCEHLLLEAARGERSPGAPEPAWSAKGELDELRRRAILVDLSQLPDFETLFLESLYLQPLRVEAT